MDIEFLKAIQRRATKLIPGLRNKLYECYSKEFDMLSVRLIFLIGDIVEACKNMNNIEYLSIVSFFVMREQDIIRGQRLTIMKNRAQ